MSNPSLKESILLLQGMLYQDWSYRRENGKIHIYIMNVFPHSFGPYFDAKNNKCFNQTKKKRTEIKFKFVLVLIGILRMTSHIKRTVSCNMVIYLNILFFVNRSMMEYCIIHKNLEITHLLYSNIFQWLMKRQRSRKNIFFWIRQEHPVS